MAKGRLPTEFQAHEIVFFPINENRGRHFHVGLLECGHFLFPVFSVELNEDGSQDGGVIESMSGIVFNLLGQHCGARPAGFAGRAPGTTTPPWIIGIDLR